VKKLNNIKLQYFSQGNEDMLFNEIFANNPMKFLSIAFSTLTLLSMSPIIYLIVLFEKVTPFRVIF